MAGNCKEVDIELFVGEVNNYPEIWNVAVETYKDKTISINKYLMGRTRETKMKFVSNY